MIEYKLITIPFLKQKDSFQYMTKEIEQTIAEEKKKAGNLLK